MSNPYGELTPKQTENWQNHGEPVYRRIPDVVDRMNERTRAGETEKDRPILDPDEVQDYYTRVYRPKKRGDGMMERDGVTMSNGDLHMIRKVVEDWLKPMGSFQGLIMASMMCKESDKMEAIGDAIAMARIGDMPKERQVRLLSDNLYVAELYGVTPEA